MRSYYRFTEDVRKTMKPAMIAFLESDSFEDAIRNAISIGGDSDTITAITGSLAEAHYAIPEELFKKIDDYILSDELKDIVNRFKDKIPPYSKK
jgi:ADP-ribosylglycohydrolase